MNDVSANDAPSPRLLRIALLLSLLLLLIALALFTLSLRVTTFGGNAGQTVTVTSDGCHPQHLEVPAGRRTFTVVNHSSRAIEWEIIDGVMVLAERENIAPGLRQTLSADLAPGHYTMTCGLLSTPGGTLEVVASADGPPPPSTADIIGVLAEYRVSTILQLRELHQRIDTLAAAISDGDNEAMRHAWLAARRSERQLALVLDLLAEQDGDSSADNPLSADLQQLEKGLFESNASVSTTAAINRLRENLEHLTPPLKALSIEPSQLADTSAGLLRHWHDRQRSAGEPAALAVNDLAGLTHGVDSVVRLLTPLLEPRAPDVLQQVRAALSALQASLADDTTTGTSAIQRLNERSLALADALTGINPALDMHASATPPEAAESP
ncbi:cupredoxin domain-containing protein [Kushneria aurantia]|uniref:Cupredoxin domain-containing protein n=1 Tax=Kushneria aurantia TaxID=504092 RepID=A0ABV6FZH5_9GAMM|nr:cupredoxin domain-containing protein [Kushneria aurantia]